MKKRLLFLAFFPQVVFAQTGSVKVKSPSELDSIIYDISIIEPVAETIKLPFGKIEVIDARFDTSKLGFTFNRKGSRLTYKDFKKIKLGGGVAGNIQRFYNNYYRSGFNGSDDKLLIVLKRLWVNNFPLNKLLATEYEIEHQSLQNIYVKFEYYLCRGNDYYPLLRTDTIYRLADEHIKTFETDFKNNDMIFFGYTLKGLIEKPDFNDFVAKATTKRKLTIDDIRVFNEKRISLPILTAVKYNEGVYSNSKEFINNSPSAKEFTINNNGNLKAMNVEDIIASMCWGFADSNGLHKTSAKEVGIFRVGNSFEFFSRETVDPSRTIGGLFFDSFSFLPGPGAISTPGSITQSRLKTIIVPRQLDMETGEVY